MNKLRAAILAIALLVAVPSIANANWTMGNDYRIEIINNSSTVISAFYATNRDHPNWDVNLLDSPIPVGGSRIVDTDDYSGYCMYDLRAEAKFNGEWTRWGVNVCEVTTWTLWD